MFDTVTDINLCLADLVAQAMCGVMKQFFAVSKGLSALGGSVERTSRAAPAIVFEFNALARSRSFIKGPRLVLIRNAEGFIISRRFAFMKPVLSVVSGQCKLMTSLFPGKCFFRKYHNRQGPATDAS